MKKINNLAYFVLGFTFVFSFFTFVNSATNFSSVIRAEEATSPIENLVEPSVVTEVVEETPKLPEVAITEPVPEEEKVEETLPKVETEKAAEEADTTNQTTTNMLAAPGLQEATLVVVPPLKGKVNATKIVCNRESDLPNWGNNGADITATTAATFLAAHADTCHKEAWKFAWMESSPIPVVSDHATDTGGASWTGFNDSTLTEVPSQTRIWFREQFKDGYIPFTGVNVTEAISAEFYCNTDVFHYDNLEFIDTVPGETYHCVAFNALKETPRTCDAGTNLIQNGNFEAPALAHATWDVIPSSNGMLKWMSAWVSPQTNGRLGLEIQNHYAGTSFEGNQHAELDGDHPVTIWQDVPTIPGKEYEVSFKYSPRAGRTLADNRLQVKVNGVVVGGDVAVDGTANSDTVWQTVTRTFVATNTTTKVEFYDNGTDTSFGGYLDTVKVICTGNPSTGGNIPPTAHAGVDQSITLPTTTATLNGSASTDSDGTITSYVWSFVSGPSTINPDDVVSPNISSLVAGTYVFELVVTDDDGAIGTDTVSITVGTGNNTAACNSDANLIQNGNFEAPVLANASWDVIPSSNPALKWMVAWVTPETNGRLGLEIQNHFAGDPFEGNQHAELDGDHPVTIWQDIATVPGQEYTISFKYSFRPGETNNGLQVKVNGAVVGANIAFDGSAFNNTVWQTITRTFVATGTTTKVEFYDYDADSTKGAYLDNISVKCTRGVVTGSNLPPVSNAGSDQTLTLPTTSTTLNGTGSTDSDGTIVSYVWSFVSGPSTINPDDVVSPNISSLVAGTYVFELVVTDDDGATGTDTVTVTVNNEGDNNNGGSSSNGGGGSSGGSRAKCNDNKDNDDDNLIDEEDPGCHSDGDANNPDSYDKRDRSENNGGEVLGASTSCGIYVDRYLRRGYNNNVDSVVKVQMFLNDYMNAGLVVDGVYGLKTEEAVRAFQVKQFDNVLDPWGISESTGIFYLTTQTEVNNIMCPSLNLPIPSDLVNFTPSVVIA